MMEIVQFFDAPTANGDWPDLTSEQRDQAITQVLIRAALTFASRMTGGVFQARTTPTSRRGHTCHNYHRATDNV